MANPVFTSRRFRRELAEVRALEEQLRSRFWEPNAARQIVGAADLDETQIDIGGAPSKFWAAILDFAAASLELEKFLESVELYLAPVPKDADMREAIERVRRVAEGNGSISPMRLLLSGDRPFLGRTVLRGLIAELRNWNSAASILVVRGEPDSGRTETQLLIEEGRDPVQEKFVLLDELLPLDSTLRAIWRAAGAPGAAPSASQETLTTESAMLMDFWMDVKDALETNNRFLWVVFDDLDKGPGRIAVQTLAEVLAIRFRDVSFQRRIRLVMLGYPGPQLPSKVTAAFVRNDLTERIDDTHVRAFVDFCAKSTGKTLTDAGDTAKGLCAKAQAKTSDVVPFLEALNGELRLWYQGL
ncbi:hypothetical protein ACU8L5_25400 (plasmid) [Rhizobium leguminosarum]